MTIFSCKRADQDYDASGTFEADEIIITAEATGKILELNLNEGDALTANQNIGLIDGKGVELQKEQVLASINAIERKNQLCSTSNCSSAISVGYTKCSN